MLRFIFIGCFVLTVAPWASYAMTPEQKTMIHEHFEKIGLECIQVHEITESDIMDLRSKKVPSGPNAPCFMACVMRKVGVLDEKGFLQKETLLEMAKKVFDDPEELNNIADYLHSCSPVNDIAVSDGEKGCERAMHAFKCMVDNSAKFGLDM